MLREFSEGKRYRLPVVKTALINSCLLHSNHGMVHEPEVHIKDIYMYKITGAKETKGLENIQYSIVDFYNKQT
jgi:hypothetical protein